MKKCWVVNDVWAVRDDFALGFKLIQAESALMSHNPAGRTMRRDGIHTLTGTHYDLDALYEELTSRGRSGTGTCIMEADWGVWKDFAIQDPDGYIGFGSGIKD